MATLQRPSDYLNRDQVLEILGVKPQTLYAYVSRGYIRSIAHPDGRSSYYAREDVERVRARAVPRAGRGAIAAGAIRWGEPVISTAITALTDAGPAYRGRRAADLARSRVAFENIAELLWSGDLAEEPVIWHRDTLPAGFAKLLSAGAALHERAHVVQLMAMAVLALGVAAGVRRERIRAGLTPVASARGVMQSMAGVLGFLGPRRGFVSVADGEPLACTVSRALGRKPAEARIDALNGALVIVADHELNPATFAARVAASGSSDLHSCIGAALNTHFGTLVGRACDRVEDLFSPQADVPAVLERARRTLDSARSLPGFDHPLYPQGDPRAGYLVESAVAVGAGNPAVQRMLRAMARLRDDYGVHPSVECGLVLLCRALELPGRSASGLYALGRTAGWVAHILEQRLANFVIRPRARYDESAAF